MRRIGIMIGALLVLTVLVVAGDPRVRVASQAWSYRYLSTLDAKIEHINDPSQGWAWGPGEGEPLSLGSMAEYIPFSGEYVEVTSIDPVSLSLVLKSGTEQTRIPMQQLDARTFRYNSRQYPISITARVTGVSPPGSPSPYALLVIKAEPR